MTGAANDSVVVHVDHDMCIGSGTCEMLEEATFLIDDDTAVASVVGSGLLPADRAAVVIDKCPSGAISIVDHTTDSAEEE